MKSIRLIVLSIAVVVITACSFSQSWNTQVYRVRKGDTLYAIAWRYQLNVHDLAKWNQIGSSQTIYPGQELILIDPKYLPQARRPSKTEQSNDTAVVSSTPRRAPRGPTQSAAAPPEAFRWPTEGKVVRQFDGRKGGSQGIDIAGQIGQAVTAAAGGKVVYSGDGLVGFGNLVIVKHSEDYLSAYGYNRQLRVKEGDNVKAGQLIAEMGQMDQGSPRLHFEIRLQGQPVDPLKYLPKR